MSSQNAPSNIHILGLSEPLTNAAGAARHTCTLIESEAYHLLREELRRYCARSVHGRSFLIAGHRGSGKTTIVQHAIHNHDGANGDLRPLFIQLIGPDLLRDTNDYAAYSGDTEISAVETGLTLQQIILGIYRPLAKEFGARFRSRILNDDSLDEKTRAQRLEMAAALDLELDEYPGLPRLREYWKRVGALQDGVLSPPGIPAKERSSDQGYRELVALSTASDAFHRISGKVEARESSTDAAKQKSASEAGIHATLKDITSLLSTLLTGGIVGTGLATAGIPIAGALFGGLVATTAATAFFRFSWSQSRERSVTRESTFIPDNSLETLERVLPVLLSRIHDAGLAPIFVIDELDKVEDLSIRMTRMIRRLKKLVAETGFFCFLTDRRYFEEVTRQNTGNPYSIEYTYYTDQVYIVFNHDDMLDYLRTILQMPADADNPAYAGDKIDIEILPYILLHDSRMHALDLRRKLCQLRAPARIGGTAGEFTVNLAHGRVRTDTDFLLKLQIQVGIRSLLQRDRVRLEINRDPTYRRLIHDALYYISRRWDDYDIDLDLDDETAFKDYLTDRMRTAHSQNGNGNANANKTPPCTGPEPTSRDIQYLIDLPRDLAELLAYPHRYVEEVADRLVGILHGDVLKVLGIGGSVPPLQLFEHIPYTRRYKWCYTPSGISTSKQQASQSAGSRQSQQGATQTTTPQPWQIFADQILAAAAALAQVSGGELDFAILADEFRILDTRPSWSAVKPDIELLATIAAPSLTDEQAKKYEACGPFLKVLEDGFPRISLAILCAALVAKTAGITQQGRLRQALKEISDAFGFADGMDKATMEATLTQFRQTQTIHSNIPSPPAAFAINASRAWRGRMTSLLNVIARIHLDDDWKTTDLVTSAWSHWDERLLLYLKDDKHLPPTVNEIAAKLAGKFPKLIDFRVNKWRLVDWNLLFFVTLTKPFKVWNDVDTGFMPITLMVPTLLGLGFRPPAATLETMVVTAAGGEEFHRRFPEGKTSINANPDYFKPWRDYLKSRTAFSQGPAALIIMKEKDSLTETWKPDSRYAALLLNTSDAEKIFTAWDFDQAQEFLRFQYIVMEVSDLSDSPDSQSKWRHNMEVLQKILVVQNPGEKSPPPQWALLRSTRSAPALTTLRSAFGSASLEEMFKQLNSGDEVDQPSPGALPSDTPPPQTSSAPVAESSKLAERITRQARKKK